jgi:tetratricopeptide (TPR) repeat protein
MERRHDEADHVLCVVSDEYLRAPYSSLERNAALWQAASKRPGFVLLVVVKPCKLPTLSDHIRRIELFGMPEEGARLRFREFMSKRTAATGTATFPGRVFAVSNIPIRVPTHFMGRDEALAEIETTLERQEGHVAITALHGLRGVGKTTVATAFAERHRSSYRATWWIRAQMETTMRADLVALGIRLGWVSADDQEERAFAAVMERLLHEGEGILLIFDNALNQGALKPFLPRGGTARVLVTSNTPAWRGVAAPVEIRQWSKETAADYLIARTGRSAERNAAETLSQALGGLPLAHEQAAAYCERLSVSLADYGRRFAATPARLLDDARYAPAEYHDGLTVAKTFALAIKEAAKLHCAAEPLFVHAALLAPEPIPLFLFSGAREEFGEPLASMLADDGLDEAVAALRDFALVDRQAIVDERDASITTDAIRLHRLVREVATTLCEGEAREQARSALVGALARVYPQEVFYSGPMAWQRARRLDAIALALVSDDSVPLHGAEKRAAELLDGLASYRHGALGAFEQARRLFERALTIREKVLGPEHPDTATSLNNLALVLQHQGDRTGVRPLYERALTIWEKACGPEHPDTATALNNLACLLRDQGSFTEARSLFERTLAIREKVLGPEHPKTAAILGNIAGLLQYQGNFTEARPLCERALAIREKVLGPEHPDTALNLISLADLLHLQGDLTGARLLYERGLVITEKALGLEHPRTAGSLNALGLLLQNQGNFKEARPLYERALAISEKACGSEHPTTMRSLNNIAFVVEAQGDLAGARPLYERALAISEKVHGPEHPDTATTLSNLARLLNKSNHAEDAEPLFERAIAIGERVLGREHPLTHRYRSHCARLFLDTGRTAEALAFAEAALAIHATTPGPNHIWTSDTAGMTADALDALGRGDEAAALPTRYGIKVQPRVSA